MDKKICVFGDSITWGAIDTEKGGWVERLKIEMFRLDRLKDIFNCGVSADTTENLLARFESEAIARRAEVIVFAIGINDSSFCSDKNSHKVPLEQFKKNVNTLIEKTRTITSEIHFVGLTKVVEKMTTPVEWIDTVHYKNEWVKQYDSCIEKTCSEQKLQFIPMFDFLDDTDLSDGLHPGPGGHRKMFERVLSALNFMD